MNAPSYPGTWREMPVTLCHDWLIGMRGGERVIDLLADGFPRSEIATLIYRRDSVSERIRRRPVHTSALQYLPRISTYYRYLLPLLPFAARSIRMPARTRLALSTNHCVAKAFPRNREVPHLCYCFTPMRYAWTFHEEYFGRGPLRMAIRPLLMALRAWDRRTAQRITHITAISRHVQTRIRAAWERESDVVYPPVNIDRCTPFDGPGRSRNEDFDLLVSALVPYKRVDLAVLAYRQLDRRLVVVGSGSDYARCAALAPEQVTFAGWIEDAAVLDLYRRCRMLIFPGEEDFGIVPVEAQACGKPVVAYARGGALETVEPGVSGVFFEHQTPDALAAAIQDCANRRWDPETIRGGVLRFSEQAFIDGLDAAIQRTLAKKDTDNGKDIP